MSRLGYREEAFLEQLVLRALLGWQDAEMFVGHLGGDTASWGAVDEPGLHEEGLQHVFDGVFFLAD